MIDIYFDKLYRYPRNAEHCSIAIPVKMGELRDASGVSLYQEGKKLPVQCKVTARHKDGSVRYLFIRMMADLPANKGTVLQCDLTGTQQQEETVLTGETFKGMSVSRTDNGYIVDTNSISFSVEDHSSHIFGYVDTKDKVYDKEQFVGPYLKDGDGNSYQMQVDEWKVVEQGPLCTILSANGSNLNAQADKRIEYELRLTAYADKPWVEVSYRLINTSNAPLKIASLVFYLKADKDALLNDSLLMDANDSGTDSTGCGDTLTDNSTVDGPVYHTRGIRELAMIQEKAPVSNVRTMVGSSNYKTDFYIGRDGACVSKYVDAHLLLKEANEHFAEVLYGTFMADRTDSKGGVCITVYQAQQNYPKAIRADQEEIAVMLVPEDMGDVTMQSGMAREQKFLMHFHKPEETICELDNRSLIYQMPDRPYISPKVFRDAEVGLNVYPHKLCDDVEIALIGKADGHARCYGMLNWGDSYDPGYTQQGRGNGKPVFCNNEYDFPHSCALLYARTGIRRFLDYLFVSAQHWMDVDVCHYSDDPLKIGGQWEHTAGHCKNGVMVCSHEWVEGLLDYYHFSGDERAYETAIGIGDNVLRLLDTPMYANAGEANARETGWALRTLTALYIETRDSRWTKKCEWIINSFEKWEEEYGNWIAPYTDNTTIRVGFMISVAVGSVMRYYREFPRDDIRDMLLRAVDDLIENCLLDNGLFYYKELPSLSRLGNNTLLLEALAIGYELTGDVKYLRPGLKTFDKAVNAAATSTNGAKKEIDDAVICAGGSTKGFAQSFIPMITYYKALSENDLWPYDRLFD